MNPFQPFQPALGQKFFNRNSELNSILQRINQGASTTVVGNPHIGKTSLLKQIARPEVLQSANLDPTQNIVVEFNFELITNQNTPTDFWRRISAKVKLVRPDLASHLESALAYPNDLNLLNEAFEIIGQNNARVVVVIDEFDKFFDIPTFATLDFFNPLRAIAMTSNGMCLVIASRLSVAELQEGVLKLKPASGSPLNFFDEVCLSTFDDDTIKTWLSQHLPVEAMSETRLLAGNHPLLLHLAGQILWDEKEQGKTKWDSHRDEFVQKAEAHFRDVWRYLSDRGQLALFLLVMRDLNGQVGGKVFDISDTDIELAWLLDELKELQKRAILEQDETGQWTIRSIGFRMWLIENKIPTLADESLDIKQWLHNKGFKFNIVTNEELETLQKIVKAIPSGVIDLAKKVFLSKSLQ